MSLRWGTDATGVEDECIELWGWNRGDQFLPGLVLVFLNHVSLLTTVLCLLVGVGVIVTFHSRIRRFNGSPLRYLLGYLFFFNFIQLELFFLSYFNSNLPSEILLNICTTLKGVSFPVRTLLLLFMFICLFKTIAWLQGVELSKGYIFGLVIFTVGMMSWFLLAIRFNVLMPESPHLTFWNLYTWPIHGLVAFFLLRLLLTNRRQEDAGRRRLVGAFVWLFIGQLVLYFGQLVLSVLAIPLGLFLISSGLVLFTNVAPLWWLISLYIPWASSLGKIIAGRVDLPALQQAHGLSDREMKVLSLMIDGQSYKEIAIVLAISVHTVKTHVYNLYRKLGVNSRHQLTHFVSTVQQENG